MYKLHSNFLVCYTRWAQCLVGTIIRTRLPFRVREKNMYCTNGLLSETENCNYKAMIKKLELSNDDKELMKITDKDITKSHVVEDKDGYSINLKNT